ncbi:hypothetical protein Tco_1161215 [Tanacetum coccineum]
MCELREVTFSRNKDEDAHDHIDREPQKDGWKDSPQELSIPGISLKRPLSKGIAHLLRPRSNLKIFTISSKKETNHYTSPGNGIMTCYTSAPLMKSIFIKRNIGSSSSKDGLVALVNKLDNLGRDIKMLKENVHSIQVGCQIYEGPHLYKDCPLNKEVKQVKEIDNRPSYSKKRQILEELLAKYQEESARRSIKIEVWIKKLQENAKINTRNKNTSLKNLETQIEQLTKELRSRKEKSEQAKFTEALDPDKDPLERCFDEYNWVFHLEIEQLADEYEINIGEKGQVLEEMWTKCKRARCKNKD